MSEILGFVCGAIAGYVVGMILVAIVAAATDDPTGGA